MREEIENLKRENDRLNAKLQVMRALLWEWNSSSGPVWEYWRLKEAGETEADYEFLMD